MGLDFFRGSVELAEWYLKPGQYVAERGLPSELEELLVGLLGSGSGGTRASRSHWMSHSAACCERERQVRGCSKLPRRAG